MKNPGWYQRYLEDKAEQEAQEELRRKGDEVRMKRIMRIEIAIEGLQEIIDEGGSCAAIENAKLTLEDAKDWL